MGRSRDQHGRWSPDRLSVRPNLLLLLLLLLLLWRRNQNYEFGCRGEMRKEATDIRQLRRLHCYERSALYGAVRRSNPMLG